MKLTKANLSLHLAASTAPADPYGSVEPFNLKHLKLNPYMGSVTASNGTSIFESRTEIPRAGHTEPFYIPASEAKKAARNLTAKRSHTIATLDKANQQITLRSDTGNNATKLPILSNPVWPDIHRIKKAIQPEAPKTHMSLSVDMLDKLVTVAQQHHLPHITLQVIDEYYPVIATSQADAGRTLTAYIMPCDLT